MNFAQAFNPWAQFAQQRPGSLGGLGGMNMPPGITEESGLGAAPVSPDVQQMMQQWASMMTQGGQNVNPFQSFGQSQSPVFRPDGQNVGGGPMTGLARMQAPTGNTGRY